MMNGTVPEELLMVAVGDLWRRQGGRLAYEVPLFEHSLDMVVVRETAPLVAIELKVRDWRRALKQAVIAQLAADEVYIAVWHAHAAGIDHNLLLATGVGLIVVDGPTARVLVSAQRSRITLCEHREAIIAWVKPADRGQVNATARPRPDMSANGGLL